jgi:hypothetical protein
VDLEDTMGNNICTYGEARQAAFRRLVLTRRLVGLQLGAKFLRAKTWWPP